MVFYRYGKQIGSVFLATTSAYLSFSLFNPSRKLTPVDDVRPVEKKNAWNHQWDITDEASPPDNKSRIKLIILVRHGQYKLNAPSSNEKVLTSLGWKQAIETGKRLRELGYKARQTTAGILSQLDEVQLAETGVLELERNAASCDSDGGVNDIIVRPSPLISKNYPLLESPLLAEGPPPAEPEPSSSSRKKYIANLSEPELSERISTQKRIYSSFQHHFHRRSINEHLPPACQTNQPVEVILFVGHANVFRYWLCRALQIPPEAWLRISLPHGSITELCVQASAEKGTCTVVALRVGDDGHMPVELQSR